MAAITLRVLCFPATSWGQDSIPAHASYRATAEAVTQFVVHEMTAKNIPGVSIALVDDQQTIWARGFGLARLGDSLPATAETIYRVGSVSKVFTALGVMQEVERGKLDLDQPVKDYLPQFAPVSSWPVPITLRHLLTHRSGLVREPPVGSYFAAGSASLAEVVESLNRTTVVYRPESTIKYSNAGVSVAGFVLETINRTPFEQLMEGRLLRPIGMRSSSFGLPGSRDRLATGTMWTIDGRRFEAPVFPLGMAPAANLYSTVGDLARFLSFLFAGGRAGDTRLIQPATLDRMWEPQFGTSGGFALGFNLGRFDGALHAGHGGAIYGFATELHALPREKLGVVVIGNLELSNTVMERIGAFAIRAMRAEKAGRPLPEPVLTQPIPSERVREMRGHFFHEPRRFELRERAGTLMLVPGGGIPVTLRRLGSEFVVDDVREFGNAFTPLSAGSIAWAEQLFTRRPAPRPEAIPQQWQGLIGEYGWDHNTLYLYEDLGRIRALIEWYFTYPLEEISDTVYAFPTRGLYAGERLLVRRDSRGKVRAVELNGIVFPRRAVGPEDGGQLKITPVRPVADLLSEARQATPPAQPTGLKSPDLVDLATLDSTLKFDIRYATTNNFVGAVFYSQPRAFLQRPAAEAVLTAHNWLRQQGYGLLIHDAYRPWYVTRVFWDATPDSLHWLVANPANGSRHNRGAAVDLTLYELATGNPVEMPGTYDEATPRSLPDYPGGTSLQRWHRELLRTAMEANGFTVYAEEWWHFDYDGWREYPVLNLPFEQLRP